MDCERLLVINFVYHEKVFRIKIKITGKEKEKEKRKKEAQ